MTESQSPIDALADAVQDHRWADSLELLKSCVEDPNLTRQRLEEILHALLRSLTKERSGWTTTLYHCGIAERVANAVARLDFLVEGHLSRAAEDNRKRALKGHDQNQVTILQTLVFNLNIARSRRDLRKFVDLQADLCREKDAADKSSPDYVSKLEDLSHESGRVFDLILDKLDLNQTSELRYMRDDLLKSLPGDMAEKLSRKLTEMESKRVIDDFSIDEFPDLPSRQKNAGVEAILEARSIIDGLYGDSSTTEATRNREAIIALERIEGHRGKSIPEYSWDQFHDRLCLGQFRKRMATWLDRQSAAGNRRDFESALDMVKLWTHCKLAGKAVLADADLRATVERAMRFFTNVQQERRKALIEEPVEWTDSSSWPKWEGLADNVKLLEVDVDISWAGWDFLFKALRFARARRFDELRGLLQSERYSSRFGSFPTSEVLADLVTEAKHSQAEWLRDMRAAMAEPADKSSDVMEADRLRRLLKLADHREFAFHDFLKQDVEASEEIALWRKLAEAREDLPDLRSQAERLPEEKRGLLVKAIDDAMVVLSDDYPNIQSGTFYDSYADLRNVLNNKHLVQLSERYPQALVTYLDWHCARVESQWQEIAVGGDLEALRVSRTKLLDAVRFPRFGDIEAVVDRRAKNSTVWQGLCDVAQVRILLKKGRHPDALNLMLSEYDSFPIAGRDDLLIEVLAGIVPSQLKREQLTTLLQLPDIDWQPKALTVLAEACFEQTEKGELLTLLDKHRKKLDKDCDYRLFFYGALESKNWGSLQALAGSNQVKRLHDAVSRVLTQGQVPEESMCALWKIFRDRLELSLEDYHLVRVSLADKEEAVKNLEDRLSVLASPLEQLPDVFTKEQFNGAIQKVKSDCQTVFDLCDRWGACVRLFEPKEDPVTRGEQVRRDFGHLQETWQKVSEMLDSGDLSGWGALLNATEAYSEEADSTTTGTSILRQTIFLLKRYEHYLAPPTRRLQDLRNWLDGQSGFQFHETTVSHLRHDYQQYSGLLRGHALADGNFEAFLNKVEEVAARLNKWLENNKAFDLQRTALRDYARNGGERPRGLEEFLLWCKEMDSVVRNNQSPKILGDWIKKWSDSSGNGWFPPPDGLFRQGAS